MTDLKLNYPSISLILLIFLWSFAVVGGGVLAWSLLALGFALLVLNKRVLTCFKIQQTNDLICLRFWHAGLISIAFGCVLVLMSPQSDASISLFYFQNENWVLKDFATFVSHNVNRGLFYIGVLGAIVLALLWPFLKSTVYNRVTATFVMFALTQILLTVLVVHEVLKPFFSRSRPRHLEELLVQGYAEPWWQIGELCTRNCSMPSGEASAAFACLAAALAWNRGALWPSLRFTFIFGAFMGWLRIGAGAHFTSDVIMSAVFMLPLSYLLWLACLRVWQARSGMLR